MRSISSFALKRNHFYLSFLCVSSLSQVALKRQQAVEDAIAMRLASNETGKSIETLPPGKIYGMSVTEPCEAPPLDVQKPKNAAGMSEIQLANYTDF